MWYTKRAMGASHGAIPFVAAAFSGAAACSIWAALDDPYKNDPAMGPDLVDGAADVRPEAAPVDAGTVNRVVDAGFSPYAITAYGDTVFAVDEHGNVYAAYDAPYDAGTRFTPFWTGDGGDAFFVANGIAASASGVFWTVNSGVHYCGIDGGACGFLLSQGSPKAIAASDSVVVWIEEATGVRLCPGSLAGCAPRTLTLTRAAKDVAAGPNEAVAWTDGQQAIYLTDGVSPSSIGLPTADTLLATDRTSGDLYWAGGSAIGIAEFDGGVGPYFPLTAGPKPTALSATGGIVYWSLRSSNRVSHCRIDDAGGCTAMEQFSGIGAPNTTTHEIAVTSQRVMALITNDDTNTPLLVVWPKR
jgi:hypothetical protein